MSDVVFDTYEAAHALRESGYEEQQAVATVSMVRDALLENVASKSDLRELETRLTADMSKLETRLEANGRELESRLKTSLRELETRLEANMSKLESRLEASLREQAHGLRVETLQLINAQTTRFYAIALGIVIACTSLTFGLIKLFP